MLRKLLLAALLGTLAACAGDITGPEADQTQTGAIVTSGG